MRRAKALFPALAFLLLAAAGAASPVEACMTSPPSFKELFAAHAIVRATAVRYVVPPGSNLFPTGVPDSTVEFRVEETLKGAGLPESVELSAYLSDKDDYNEDPVPYRLVRPGGRGGSCFANTYRQGAQFLLFLKKTAGGYTSNIVPLGPTNEQLKSETDPWLLWVKVRLNPCGKLYAHTEYDQMERELYLAFSRERVPPDHQYRVARCYLQKYEAQVGLNEQFIKYIKRWVEHYEKFEERR